MFEASYKNALIFINSFPQSYNHLLNPARGWNGNITDFVSGLVVLGCWCTFVEKKHNEYLP